MNLTLRRIFEWTMLALLAARPSLDALTHVSIGGVWRVNPAALSGVLLLACGAVWLLLLSTQERGAVLKNNLFAGFMAWWLLLSPWAVLPYIFDGPGGAAGVREWIRLASYAPLVLLAIYYGAQSKQRLVLNALLLSFAVPALVGAYQLIFQTGASIQGFHRIQGTFVHPNPYSFYLICVIAVLYNQWRANVKSWLTLGLLAMAAVLLLATFSLTGWGMVLVWIAVAAWFEGRAARIVLVALCVILAAGILATDTGRARLAALTTWDDLDEIERTKRETGSHSWRLLNWRFLYREWKKQPVFGYGLASSPSVNPNINVIGGGVGHDPHNDYVRYLVETGAVGLFVWLAFLGWVGKELWRSFKRAHAPPQQRSAWTAIALYTAWIIGSLNDNLITATGYQYVLWTIFALSCAPREDVQ